MATAKPALKTLKVEDLTQASIDGLLLFEEKMNELGFELTNLKQTRNTVGFLFYAPPQKYKLWLHARAGEPGTAPKATHAKRPERPSHLIEFDAPAMLYGMTTTVILETGNIRSVGFAIYPCNSSNKPIPTMFPNHYPNGVPGGLCVQFVPPDQHMDVQIDSSNGAEIVSEKLLACFNANYFNFWNSTFSYDGTHVPAAVLDEVKKQTGHDCTEKDKRYGYAHCYTGEILYAAANKGPIDWDKMPTDNNEANRYINQNFKSGSRMRYVRNTVRKRIKAIAGTSK